MKTTLNDQEYRSYVEAKTKADKLGLTLRTIIRTAEHSCQVLRILTYTAAFGVAWFYYEDMLLATAIATSLAVAHGFITAIDFLNNKLEELDKWKT